MESMSDLGTVHPREADDSLGLPEPRDLRGDVEIEFDIRRPRDDRLSQEGHTFQLAPLELPTVLFPAT